MEANMSLLKRRLNKAMLECRWQASCTARRLAGRMQVARNQPGRNQPGRHHFSYSFQQRPPQTESVARGQLTRTKPNCGDEEEQQQVVEEFSSDDSQDHQQHHQHHHRHHRPSQKMSPRDAGGHFVRSSALSGSRRHNHQRGSSRRRRSHRAARQVRFQPIPQSLGAAEEAENSNSGANKCPKTRARLGQLQMRLQVAHKPLARRLQHLKFAKIKLKSFNTIAQQLHQTLVPSSASVGQQQHQQQQQQHHHQPGQDQQDSQDDYGWGSDFDEQSLDSSSNDPQTTNSYLLEIGRPSEDKRAIDDVIQDRGISGQFKRLEVGDEAQQVPTREAVVVVEDYAEEEDEDEEELRSLEARQGFRQIKDKLKVILDQRLADYERSASASSGATCEPSIQVSTDGEAESCKIPTKDVTATATTTATTTPPNPKSQPVDVDDCQSHCSDDSSLASNHSGSQDSGHSTQHSGYSAHCPLDRHHRHQHQHQQPGSIETQSSSETGEPISQATQTIRANQPPTATIKPSGDDSDERRSRFLQNRLIINSKLESMFQQRASPSKVSLQGCERKITTASATAAGQVQRSQTMAARSKSGEVYSLAKAETTGATKFDEETRLRLLEQQRQMSLKLKQKPRRRTAAARSIRQTGETKPEVEQYNELGSYASARDSLTKQLSMVCLGGGGGGNQRGPSYEPNSASNLQTRPAQSLRQLVTEVIDDCERPSKLSTLTMSILNRSDSSSSDLAISADDLTASSPLRQPGASVAHCNHQQSPDPKRLAPASPYQLHHQLRLAALNGANLSASSVGSTIDGLEYSPVKDEEPVVATDGEPSTNGQKQGQKSQHTKLGSYLKSLREFSKFKLPKVRLDGVKLVSSSNNNNNPASTTTERPPVEPRLVAGARQHLISTHSTLAGAWRRRCQATNVASSKAQASQLGSAASVLANGSQGEAFANHFVTISNRKWKSCHLRTSLMQVAFNSAGGAAANTGASSPVCASKQHLAYLDNSRNFTDDDNY